MNKKSIRLIYALWLVSGLLLGCAEGSSVDDMTAYFLVRFLRPFAEPAATYTISGTVSGLAGGEEVVLSIDAEQLIVKANGVFTFKTMLANAASYNVQVVSTTALACTAGSNAGTIASQNITDISVLCGTPRILSVRVMDLDAAGTPGSGLIFQNNGAADLSVTAFNTPTAFSVQVVEGATYNISVLIQPSAPNQVCSAIATGSGLMPASALTVDFGCSTNYYTVSLNVSGLAGSGLRLRNNNNAGDELTPASDGTLSFGTLVTAGLPYAVTIEQHPANLNQTCSVGANASGTILGNTTVSVVCVTHTYTVSGTVGGLGSGESVTLQLNGGNNVIISSPTTTFNFPAIPDGALYMVTVLSTPGNSGCYATNAGGTIAGASVLNVTISCGTCIGSSGNKTIDIVWDASRSYDVKTAAGGFHRIYYATGSGVSKTTPNFLDIANTTSTTTGTISNLWPGCTYSIRVAGFSALNASGGALSTEGAVAIPLN